MSRFVDLLLSMNPGRWFAALAALYLGAHLALALWGDVAYQVVRRIK